jgi:hypothetical protein
MTGATTLAAPPAVGQRLHDFLAASRLEVLDVARGVAEGTRRLVLGSRVAHSASYAVAVAHAAGSAPAVAAEARMLGELALVLPPDLRGTVPTPVGPVDVDGRPALVVTGVPGLLRSRRRDHTPPQRCVLDAVQAWLTRLWVLGDGPDARVDLGRDAAGTLYARYAGSAPLAPALGAVHAARDRLAGLEIRRTISHGHLSPRLVSVLDGAVVGVDDWGSGAVCGDPLRDLGGYAVRGAGPRLCEVVAGRTAYARAVRDFIGAGLDTLGLPATHWRDVALLTQAERAVRHLERGSSGQVEVLARAVAALPHPGRTRPPRSPQRTKEKTTT